MDSTIKAKQTREHTQRARAELFEEKAEAVKLVRVALHRILEDSTATPEEILRAAELLAQLACPCNY